MIRPRRAGRLEIEFARWIACNWVVADAFRRTQRGKDVRMAAHKNNYPKLHNAAWPGLVGKGPDSEPPIDLDTMINMTAAASVPV